MRGAQAIDGPARQLLMWAGRPPRGNAGTAVDAATVAVSGATVASAPAATSYCYDQGGFPNKSATMTDTDGVAVMFNVTGAVTVSATKTGATFKSHSVNAVAGAFTTTLITE